MNQQDIDASPWGLSRLALLMACCMNRKSVGLANKDGCRCGSNILAKSTARRSKLSIQEHFLGDFSSERTFISKVCPSLPLGETSALSDNQERGIKGTPKTQGEVTAPSGSRCCPAQPFPVPPV